MLDKIEWLHDGMTRLNDTGLSEIEWQDWMTQYWVNEWMTFVIII